MRSPLVLELFSTDEARDRLRRLQETQDANIQPGQLRTNRYENRIESNFVLNIDLQKSSERCSCLVKYTSYMVSVA